MCSSDLNMARKKKKDGHIGLVLAGALAAGAAASYYFYGPKSKANRRKIKSWTLKAKGDLLAKVERMKAVDAAKYAVLVDQVVNRYKKMKDVSTKEAEDFRRELKKQWKEIEKDMAPPNKKTPRKKTASKKKATRKKK